MKNNLFIMARNNNLICRKIDDAELHYFELTDIKSIPNIPFYYHLWDNSDRLSKEFRIFVLNMYKDNFLAKVVKAKVHLAVPDDAVFVDERILMEFFILSCAREIIPVKECLLLTKTNNNYVSITKTERMFVLNYVKDRSIQNTYFLENRKYSTDEIISRIKSLHYDCEYGNPKILLNGNNLSEYSQLGEIVLPETILENYVEISDSFNK